MREIIETEKAPKAIGPYSQAIKTGNMLFISGQIPLDPNTNKVVGENIEEQTTQCFKNIIAILEKAEYTLGNIVSCNVFLTNLNDYDKMNEIYTEIFKETSESTGYPSRAAIEVAALPKGVKIEIQSIAMK